MKTGILLMLAILSFLDLRKRSFPMIPVLAAAAALFLCRFLLLKQDFSFYGILAGVIPGGLAFLLSLLSRGAIGGGDALLLLLLGILAGFWNTSAIAMLAVLLAAGAGLLLMASGKAGKKTELPFIPFLMTAYVLLLAANLMDL